MNEARTRPGLTAAWLLAACLLAIDLSGARAAQNPFNVTDTGPVGASAEPLLPALSTFVTPSATFGFGSEMLGSTHFRWAALKTTRVHRDRDASSVRLLLTYVMTRLTLSVGLSTMMRRFS